MRIGITYDLKDDYLKAGFAPEDVAEFDSIQTIDAIDFALRKLGFETERIGNIKDVVAYLAGGKRCDAVFNIAEGLYGFCREAQIPAILDAYRIPYVFSDALVLGVALHKGFAKAIVARAGVSTAEYRVVSSVKEIDQLAMRFPLFVKPVGGGTGMGIDSSSIVYDSIQLHNVVAKIVGKYHQDAIIETYLDGREFTVGITGTGDVSRPVATMEILVDKESDMGIYSYKSKQQYERCASYRLADEAARIKCEQVALGAWKALGCRDGGRIDLKMDTDEHVYFLEVNPLAGLHPIDSDLPILARMVGIGYDQLIGMIMNSAIKRIAGRTRA